MELLVSGNKSGLGKHLVECWNCNSFGRDELELIPSKKYDAIIHCAFNSLKNVSTHQLCDYVNDSVLLTDRLLSTSYYKFIYISTVDLYGRTDSLHKENEILNFDTHDPIYSMYTAVKFMSESLVRSKCKNYLILRPTSLIGPYSRKNTAIKIISGDSEIFLSSSSQFNCILSSDVAKFICFAISEDLTGTYNIASNVNMNMEDVANMFNKKVTFGKYFYTPGNIDNRKVCSVTDIFNKSTKQCLEQFYTKNKIILGDTK